MGINALKLKLFKKLKILVFRDFMKKYNLKNVTMNESQLQKVYNLPIYPRDSKYSQIKGL